MMAYLNRETILCVFFLTTLTNLLAASTKWDNSLTGTWNNNGNWSSASFPNGKDQVATFSSNPIYSGSITSDSPIMLGEFNLNTLPGRDLVFNFGNNDLIFDSTYLPLINLANSQNHTIIANISINPTCPPLKITVNENSKLTVLNSTISGNFITKSGTGTLLFEGNNSFLGISLFNKGVVQIGHEATDIVYTKTIGTIDAAATLSGFGILCVEEGVNNFGKVIPGGLNISHRDIGTLTIRNSLSSGYIQNSTGILMIKAFNVATADKLIVKNGKVSLGGTLILEASNAVFNPGDTLTIIENSGGMGISGIFSNFIPNIPPDIIASIQYNPFDVTIHFSSKPLSNVNQELVAPPLVAPPLVAPPLVAPPSNFKGVLKKNKSPKKIGYTLKAKWDVSPSENIILYRIYRKGELIMEVPFTSPLKITRKLRTRSSKAAKKYEITAVNSSNIESSKIKLEIVK
jgi:autotransporter-associated beta strand protein